MCHILKYVCLTLWERLQYTLDVQMTLLAS